MRSAIRVRHYSIRTEEAYLAWVKRFSYFHRKHPRELEADDLNLFLTHLAVHDYVAASTQRPALSAILFLYRHVLKVDPPWIEDVVRARQPKRLPTVLSREEVAALLSQLDGTVQLVVMLLYGTGMRILECLRIWIESVDFDLGVITIRDGKEQKDRTTLLPSSCRGRRQNRLRGVPDARYLSGIHGTRRNEVIQSRMPRFKFEPRSQPNRVVSADRHPSERGSVR